MQKSVRVHNIPPQQTSGNAAVYDANAGLLGQMHSAVYSAEQSILSDGTANGLFPGNFGLAWYQSDIQANAVGNATVTIHTILVNQIFGSTCLSCGRSRSSCSTARTIFDHGRKRLVTVNVTSNLTAEWIAVQVTEALAWDEAPRYLIRDRDGAFGPA